MAFNWTYPMIEIVRRMASEGHSDIDIAAATKTTPGSVCGIRKRHNIQSPMRLRSKPPADFAKLASTMTAKEAKDHFKAHADTITRWHKQCGTEPVQYTPKVAVKIARDRGRISAQWGANLLPARNDTLADQAQRTLQYFGPCFRVKTRLPSDTSGDWIVDNKRMSEPDMLALAERKGRKAA